MEKKEIRYLRALLPIVLFYGVSFLTLRILEAAGVPDPMLDGAQAAVSAAVLLPVLFLLYQKEEAKWEHRRTPARGGRRAVLLICAVCGGALFSLGMSALMRWAGIYKMASNAAQERLLAAPLWLQLLGPGLLVPLCEEMIYRGLCFGWLKELLPVPAAALVVSGLFALGHGNLIQIVYAFPASLLLCLAFEQYGGLAAPVLFHLGANLFSILLSYIG